MLFEDGVHVSWSNPFSTRATAFVIGWISRMHFTLNFSQINYSVNNLVLLS